MPTYEFSDAAEADLADIVDYTLRVWEGTQALKYVDGLENLAQSLAEAPTLGQPCFDLFAEMRAFPYQSHVLYYLEKPDGIIVARVLHKSMNANLHFA